MSSSASALCIKEGVNKEYITAYQHQVKIILGISTDYECDAMVYETNQQMGISKNNLAKKIGTSYSELEHECKMHIQKKGPLSVGTATLMKLSPEISKKLKCKYIIFTSKPQWFGNKKGEESKLKDCVRNSLEIAHQIGSELKSISFPAIGTEIGGIPRDRCASIMWKTVLEWCQFRKSNTSIKQILFITPTKETVSSFIQQYEQETSGRNSSSLQSNITGSNSSTPRSSYSANVDTSQESPKIAVVPTKVLENDLLDDVNDESITFSPRKRKSNQKPKPEESFWKKSDKRGAKRKSDVRLDGEQDGIMEKSPKKRHTSQQNEIDNLLSDPNIMSVVNDVDVDAMSISTSLQVDQENPSNKNKPTDGVPFDMSLAEDQIWRNSQF